MENYISMDSPLKIKGTKCSACLAICLEPLWTCSECGSESLEEISISPQGSIYTFTEVHVGFGHMANKVPYILAIIETEGMHKLTAVIENSNQSPNLEIGTKVRLSRIDETIGPVFEISL